MSEWSRYRAASYHLVLSIAVFLLPAVLLAGAASGPLGRRVEGPGLRGAVLVVASLAAVGLLWRAFG